MSSPVLALAPIQIHSQQGLRIWKNSRNGFTVCRLHYSADPRKRAPEWAAEAARGMSSAKFRQEYEIDYSAHMGEKAFPEIVGRRHEIVIDECPYSGGWPSHLPMWGGFDYGARNPSSFHIYTVVDGITYAIWEMYGACRNLIQFVDVMKQCPYWNQIRYIVHDPDMGNLKMRSSDLTEMVSVRSQFEKLGVTKWVQGVNEEAAWLSQMQKHWCGPEVTFKILAECRMMIEEFEQATFVSMSERQLETQNYREKLIDRNNHSLDDCKYFMNSTAQQSRSRPLRIPDLASSYGWASGPVMSSVPNRQRELGMVV